MKKQLLSTAVFNPYVSHFVGDTCMSNQSMHLFMNHVTSVQWCIDTGTYGWLDGFTCIPWYYQAEHFNHLIHPSITNSYKEFTLLSCC